VEAVEKQGPSVQQVKSLQDQINALETQMKQAPQIPDDLQDKLDDLQEKVEAMKENRLVQIATALGALALVAVVISLAWLWKTWGVANDASRAVQGLVAGIPAAINERVNDKLDSVLAPVSDSANKAKKAADEAKNAANEAKATSKEAKETADKAATKEELERAKNDLLEKVQDEIKKRSASVPATPSAAAGPKATPGVKDVPGPGAAPGAAPGVPPPAATPACPSVASLIRDLKSDRKETLEDAVLKLCGRPDALLELLDEFAEADPARKLHLFRAVIERMPNAVAELERIRTDPFSEARRAGAAREILLKGFKRCLEAEGDRERLSGAESEVAQLMKGYNILLEERKNIREQLRERGMLTKSRAENAEKLNARLGQVDKQLGELREALKELGRKPTTVTAVVPAPIPRTSWKVRDLYDYEVTVY
jgi:septum formation inhibitor MinC